MKQLFLTVHGYFRHFFFSLMYTTTGIPSPRVLNCMEQTNINRIYRTVLFWCCQVHHSIKYYICTWLNHKQDMHWIRLFHVLHMCVLHLASLALQCYKQKSGRAWGGGYTCIYIFHARKSTVSVTLHSHIGPVCRRMCLALDRGSSPCQPSTERLAASQRSWARGGTLSHQGQGRGHSCSWEELYEWQRPQPPPQLSSGRWSVITTFRKH